MISIKQLSQDSCSVQFATVTFIIGTLLFLLYLIFPKAHGIIIAGFYFVIIAILSNGLLFLILLVELILNTNNRKKNILKILILLANIPISILYFMIVLSKINSSSPF